MSKSPRFWIKICSLVIVTTFIILAWYYMEYLSRLTINGLATVIFIATIIANIIINQYLIQDKLIMRDNLFEYPWYKLAIAGTGIITIMTVIDDPFHKLTATFAICSIVLGRDHRWSAFLALDMLVLVIIMLLLDQQAMADNSAIYLYYFLVIATVTSICNPDKEATEA